MEHSWNELPGPSLLTAQLVGKTGRTRGRVANREVSRCGQVLKATDAGVAPDCMAL